MMSLPSLLRRSQIGLLCFTILLLVGVAPLSSTAQTASFTIDPTTTPNIGQTVTLDGTASSGDKYTWFVDGSVVGGGTVGDPGLAFDTSFASAGARDVTLQVTKQSDCDPFVDPDCDPGPETDSQTETITVQDPPPNASDDAYSTGENSNKSGNVLSNDSDPDGDNLSASLVSGPSKGQLSFNNNGSFTFDPNGEFEGLSTGQSQTTTFTYKASDGDGGSDQATVSITINGNNDPVTASNDSYSTSENANESGNVLDNDSDVDGDNLSATLVTGPSKGQLSLNGNGSFTFDPNGEFEDLAVGQSQTVTFAYKANDGNGSSDQAAVSITVNGRNDAVTASNDNYSTDESTSQSGNVLDNDSDVDGDRLSASLVSGPSKGQLNLNNDGSFTFNPNGEFASLGSSDSRTVSFDYKARDGNGSADQATASITVNGRDNAVTAKNDSYSTDEGSTLTVSAPGLLDNDSDPDNTVTAHKVSGPAKGSITSFSNDGSFTFEPSGDFAFLTDGASTTVRFEYRAEGGSESDTASVSITVNGENSAPIAKADGAYTTREDRSLAITDPNNGVLTNDRDPEGKSLETTRIVTPPQGTVTSFNANGTFRYTPPKDMNGTDSFSYEVSDGQKTATATVTITVEKHPDIALADGSSYDPPSPSSGTDDNPVGRFELRADETTPSGTAPALSEVTIANASSETPTGIEALELWWSSDDVFSPSRDTLVRTKFYGSSSSFSGSATFTGVDQAIPTSGTQYVFVVVDLRSSAKRDFAPVIRSQTEISFSDGSLSAVNGADGGRFTDLPLSNSPTALPVELARFEGTQADQSVRLRWTTASETDNAEFRIQRRAGTPKTETTVASAKSARFQKHGDPNRKAWETISTVQGAGTTTEPQTYRFTDRDLPYEADTLAYRLKQIDTNGSSSVTTPVFVHRRASSVDFRGVAPNPARTRATIRFAVPQKQHTTVRLFDVLGRKVQTVLSRPVEGRQKQTIDVSHLPSGLYLLRLRTENATKTKRMTVVR